MSVDLESARSLAPRIRELADETEAGRRVPPELALLGVEVDVSQL